MRWRVVVPVVLAACGEGSPAAPDAPPGADAPALPDSGPRDAVAPLTWVDFTAAGCASLDAEGPTCRGPAPLSLRFAALSAAPLTTWLWSFGDGSPVVTEASPTHLFAVPGRYDVTLTAGGPGGTAQAEHPGFVLVEPVGLGERCQVDEGCAAGLECVCGEGAACPASLTPGLCARACDASPDCGAGAVCADLSPAGEPDVEGWRRPLCLRACAGDEDCAAGLACRELRAPGGAAGWVRGCFAADLLGDDGTSCRGPDGQLDPRRCASGACVELGARGLCATPCVSLPCPSYAACAAFAGGPGPACLARCGERPCAGDPWLACEVAGGSGDLGFTVDEAPAAGGYCAPGRCAEQTDCGPSGACTPLGGASFCTAP